MGCIYFKSRSRQQPDSRELIPEKKEYSWDKRPKLNPKDFTLENITDCTSIRAPGSVAGKQFIIQNCKDAFIYVLDHCSTVTVDDCSNCKIILGPTRGSVFIRSCENCVLIALCGQFRARDCHKLTAYLLCPSQPAIESCSKIRVGCCSLSYAGLREQVAQAGLSPFNNQWNLVYDFTPVPSEGANWRTVTCTSEQLDALNSSPSDTETLTTLDFIVGDALRSDVPLTSGCRSGSNDDCCLAVVLPSSQQVQHALDFITAMTNLDGRFELVETRERSLSANVAKKFLHGSATLPASDTPLQLVGLHFRGPGCVEKCQQVVAHLSLSPDCSGQIFVSPTSEVARKQIQNFMAATDHC